LKKRSWIIILGLLILDVIVKLIAVGAFNHPLKLFNYDDNFSMYSQIGPTFGINDFRIIQFGFLMNDQFAFGGEIFGFKFQIPMVILILLSFLAIFLLVYLYITASKSKFDLYHISLILLIAGASGNLIDRLLYGAVIDYVGLPFVPIIGNTLFNLADAYLNIGLIMMVIHLLFFDNLKNKKTEIEES